MTFIIDVLYTETKKDLPKSVKSFFMKLIREHSKKMKFDAYVIEEFSLSINMGIHYATLRTQTSNFDKSRHYLDQYKEQIEKRRKKTENKKDV